MARLENHKYSIQEAFKECFYIVPDYQREYVWTEKEVLQLLNDITDQIDATSDTEYFVGTVLVSPVLEEKNHFEVIDGQQRLTTSFLLLCALRYRFKGHPQHQLIGDLLQTSYADSKGDIKKSLKLEPRYENSGEVIQKIVELDDSPSSIRQAISSANITSFGSLENLLNAYATISHYLEDNFSDDNSLRQYWGYLVNNVVFIQISTDISSALKIFETINERGVGLNPMDLLKNLLFTQVKTKDFTKLKDLWKKITGPLEKNKEKPLRFLRYFLMANYKIQNKRNEGIVREDEIYNWFTNKDNAALCDYQNKPFEFVRKVTRNVELYLAFAEGCGNDRKPNVAMSNLKKMCGGAFSLHYVLLLAAANFPKPLFDHFVGQLESFLFYTIYTKTQSKELERLFSLWADELRAIGEISEEDLQIKELNQFIEDRFKTYMDSKTSELRSALMRYTFRSMQQYRTRYLLSKLTQFVDMAYKGIKVPPSLDDYTSLEMEHILPNNPDKDLRSHFTECNSDADYDEYKIKLGNFTLLEKPINIVASNKFFESKKDVYKKCKYYLTSSIVELNTVGKNSSINRVNEKLQSFNDWTAESIDNRQEMLVNLAEEIWKTSLISED